MTQPELEAEFGITVIEGLKEHPKLMGRWVQLLAVRGDEVLAWATGDDYDEALELLADELESSR